MLIRHLDFFVTLAEEGHFGRAAELCGVSQPALSLAIRKLEEDLGMPLILRGQRFLGLTAEGEKVLVWGRQILSDYGNLRADLSGHRKGGLTGLLRLGVAPVAIPLVPRFCEYFESRNPLARIQIIGLAMAEIEAGLADFSLDGGFGWLPGRVKKSDHLTRVALWRLPLVFACPADHPFASGGPVTLADVATQPLCQCTDPDPGMPATLRPSVLCSGLDAVLAHLRSGAWCSLVPNSLAALLAPDDDIRLIPLSDAPAERPIGGFLIRRLPQSPMVRALQEALESFAARSGSEAQG